MQAKRVRRYLTLNTRSDTYALIGRYPRSVILTGQGDQVVQGCAATARMTSNSILNPTGAMKALSQCRLGSGNQVDGI